MATYTAVADANGDFIVPFSSAYTSGEKITVTAEKDSATKSIELFAPSDVTGGGVIQFTGTLDNFPNNIGGVILSEISGGIGNYAFSAVSANALSLWKKATSLTLTNSVTSIGSNAFSEWTNATQLTLSSSLRSINQGAFSGWTKATSLSIPDSVLTLGQECFYGWVSSLSLHIGSGLTSIPIQAFDGWAKATSLAIPDQVKNIGAYAFRGWSLATSLLVGAGVTSIEGYSFMNWASCNEIICRALIPPTITNTSFNGLKSTCIFKVPAASVAAYQAAPNWSAFASRIQAI